MNLRYLVGTLYLVYGITKLILSLILLHVPYEQIIKVPVLSLFARKDHTVASEMYEWIFVVFASYTILYGLTMFYLLPRPIAKVLEYKYTELIIMMFLGIFLVIFYILVLYTNLPIDKDPNNAQLYKLLGFGGGLSFIVIPIIWEAIIRFIPIFKTMSKYLKAVVVLVSVVILATIITVLIYFYKRYKLIYTDNDRDKTKEEVN